MKVDRIACISCLKMLTCLAALILLQNCTAPHFLTLNQQEVAALSSQQGTGQGDDDGSVAEWTALFVRIGLQQFGVANNLPDDHVATYIESVKQFEAGQNAGLSLTWFGHSSFLIRSQGISILTDPVFSQSIGFGLLRTNRLVPVMPNPDVIQELDAIIISHGDLDHLDLRTLHRLAIRFPNATLFVPRNTARIVRNAGFRNIRELGWYESQEIDGGQVIAVPAIHAFRRPPWPVNSAHWNGYRLNLPGGNLYFAGDTAAGSILNDIPERTGPAEFALVPAGGYAPRKLEQRFHATPEQAADIARMAGARLAIAMHWGTFHLSDDLPAEQQRRFLAASSGRTRTAIMKIGETRILRQ